jgi:hypothetical protein
MNPDMGRAVWDLIRRPLSALGWVWDWGCSRDQHAGPVADLDAPSAPGCRMEPSPFAWCGKPSETTSRGRTCASRQVQRRTAKTDDGAVRVHRSFVGAAALKGHVGSEQLVSNRLPCPLRSFVLVAGLKEAATRAAGSGGGGGPLHQGRCDARTQLARAHGISRRCARCSLMNISTTPARASTSGSAHHRCLRRGASVRGLIATRR